MQHWFNVDYRDRWRKDADGFPLLTLRRVGVLIRHLPAESAVNVALGSSGWTLEHYLLAHLFHATAGQPHPALPKQREVIDPAREKARREAAQRRKQREQDIANGLIT